MDEIKFVKEQLYEYRYIQQEIKELDAEITELGKFNNKATYNPNISNLHSKLNELSKQCMEIDRKIEKLPPLERLVLRNRYIYCYQWADICEKIGYGWAQTYRIHRRALIKYIQITKYETK